MIYTEVIGRVIKEPEWQENGGFKSVKMFIAANTDVRGENGYYVSNFFMCSFYGKLATMVAERVHKGMQVFVGGRSKLSMWQDKQSGETKASVQISVSMFDFCEKNPDKSDIGTAATPNASGLEF